MILHLLDYHTNVIKLQVRRREHQVMENVVTAPSKNAKRSAIPSAIGQKGRADGLGGWAPLCSRGDVLAGKAGVTGRENCLKGWGWKAQWRLSCMSGGARANKNDGRCHSRRSVHNTSALVARARWYASCSSGGWSVNDVPTVDQLGKCFRSGIRTSVCRGEEYVRR